MAAALPLPADNLSLGLDSYPRRFPITDLDYNDSRYPTLGSSSSRHRPSSSFPDQPTEAPRTDVSRASWVDFSSSAGRQDGYNDPWVGGKHTEEPSDQVDSSLYQTQDADLQVESRLPDGAGGYNTLSASQYLPSDTFDSRQRPNSAVPSTQGQPLDTFESGTALRKPGMGQRVSGLDQYRDQQHVPSNPKHPSLPAPGVGAGGNMSNGSPIVPLSAGPSYSSAAMAIPISPKPKAYAQHPTYITPSPPPNPINPVYSPPRMQKEEICVECAMRDQDMADVDVTGPGVWRRDSDADYDELLQRELDEEATGMPQPDNSSRPRARGGKLTEEHMKLWLAIVSRLCFLVIVLFAQRAWDHRTPKSHRLVSKLLTSTSRPSDLSSRQRRWHMHEPCANLANLTTRCGMHTLNSVGRHMNLAAVPNQQMTLVVYASRHPVRSQPRTPWDHTVARSRFWKTA